MQAGQEGKPPGDRAWTPNRGCSRGAQSQQAAPRHPRGAFQTQEALEGQLLPSVQVHALGRCAKECSAAHVAAFSLSTLHLCPIVSCSSKAPLVADAVYITWKYCKFRRCVKTSKQVCIALDAPTSSAQSNEGALQASSRHFCLRHQSTTKDSQARWESKSKTC